MEKGVEAHKRAESLQLRAAAVGTAGISSDDPEAVAKLKAKLATLDEDVARMKRANAALRREDHDALVELGFTEGQIAKLREPDFAGRVGFPAYVFINAVAEARRLRARIQRLERRQQEESRTYVLEDGTRIVFNVEANRVQIVTPGKADEARRGDGRWAAASAGRRPRAHGGGTCRPMPFGRRAECLACLSRRRPTCCSRPAKRRDPGRHSWPGVAVEIAPELSDKGPKIHFIVREPSGIRIGFALDPRVVRPRQREQTTA